MSRAPLTEFCNHLYYTLYSFLHNECTLPGSKPPPRNLTRRILSADEYFPQLIDCISEAASGFPNISNTYVNLTDTQVAQLFINASIRVLAKTRCSYMNPVTGEDDDIVNKLHPR